MQRATLHQIRTFEYLAKKYKNVACSMTKRGTMLIDHFTGVGTMTRKIYRRNGRYQFTLFQNKKIDFQHEDGCVHLQTGV